MPRFAEVTRTQWIAAAPATVRAQFADVEQGSDHLRGGA
jgi:hypothetical protein